MRNLFDQYSQPENRLTHALGVCLNEDRSFLADLLKLIKVVPPIPATKLKIVEQQMPGDEAPDSSGEEKGLPDLVIHDNNAWCLLIESKIMAPLTKNQLDRHRQTLKNRGFNKIHILALTRSREPVPKNTIDLTWSDIYTLLGSNVAPGTWGNRLREYLRVAEVQLVRQNYLTEGTLTKFDGFPFSKDNPYTYGEARRLIKLAMDELRKDRALISLGMDPKAPGRHAITGRSSTVVWDYLSLKDRPKHGAFTAYPHLTLGVAAKDLEVAVTVPNSVSSIVRSRLSGLGVDGFIELNSQIIKRATFLKGSKAGIEAYAEQRHYLSQRSMPSLDARIHFRLETSLRKQRGPIKVQRNWVSTIAGLWEQKRSNIQFGYIVRLPWGTKGLDTRESLEIISRAWCSLKPLLDCVRGIE